jgi:hypothetical protein
MCKEPDTGTAHPRWHSLLVVCALLPAQGSLVAWEERLRHDHATYRPQKTPWDQHIHRHRLPYVLTGRCWSLDLVDLDSP